MTNATDALRAREASVGKADSIEQVKIEGRTKVAGQVRAWRDRIVLAWAVLRGQRFVLACNDLYVSVDKEAALKEQSP